MFLKYQELVHKIDSKDVETQQQSNFALDLYGMYNQIQGNNVRNEHWRLRDNLRESEIDQLEKMLHSKATRRAELENKLYTDRNENLHARLGVAERAIAEGAIRGKQHAQLMSEKISDTSDELTGLLNELNMIEGEIAKQEIVFKEIKDGKGKNNTTAQGRRQPPPRQFSNDEIARIRDARGETNHDMHETVVEGFSVKINRHHLGTLSGLNWLNDEVINFYRELLQERELKAVQEEGRERRVWFTNTFFISKLSEGGYNYRNVRRWTKRAKVDIFSLRLMLIPMNVGGSHWTCAAINFPDKTITYYDSMGASGRLILEILKRYLMDEHENKKKSALPNIEAWRLISPKRSVPQQQNCSDCGVFMCQFLNYLSVDDAFDFSQKHMQNFRMKMCLEIINKQLFD